MKEIPIRPEIRALRSYSLDTEAPVPVRAKLDFNESPYDVPDEIKERVASRLLARRWALYPEFGAGRLRRAIAAAIGRRSEEIVVGNGSGETVLAAINVFAGGGGTVVLTPPTFSLYPQLAAIAGAQLREVPLSGDDFAIDEEGLLSAVARDSRAIPLICSPNNPTGGTARVGFLRKLAAAAPVVLVDQAYVDFAPTGASAMPLVAECGNVVVFRTLSKAYSAAGFRIGYAVAADGLAREIAKAVLPFNIDHASEELAVALLEDPAAARARVAGIVAERERIVRALSALGAKVAPAAGNFVFVAPPGRAEAGAVRQALLLRGILVRDLGPQAPGRLRVTVGRPEENDLFLAEFARAVKEAP
jgi:histidinol-phosphate aminotransferase